MLIFPAPKQPPLLERFYASEAHVPVMAQYLYLHKKEVYACVINHTGKNLVGKGINKKFFPLPFVMTSTVREWIVNVLC